MPTFELASCGQNRVCGGEAAICRESSGRGLTPLTGSRRVGGHTCPGFVSEGFNDKATCCHQSFDLWPGIRGRLRAAGRASAFARCARTIPLFATTCGADHPTTADHQQPGGKLERHGEGWADHIGGQQDDHAQRDGMCSPAGLLTSTRFHRPARSRLLATARGARSRCKLVGIWRPWWPASSPEQGALGVRNPRTP